MQLQSENRSASGRGGPPSIASRLIRSRSDFFRFRLAKRAQVAAFVARLRRPHRGYERVDQRLVARDIEAFRAVTPAPQVWKLRQIALLCDRQRLRNRSERHAHDPDA